MSSLSLTFGTDLQSRLPAAAMVYGFFICALLFAIGCIVPPPEQPPSFVAPDELRVISLVRRGKEYSASGRADLAEREFRTALRLSPNNESIYNDLGFVLLSQGRAQEARDLFEKGLKLAPSNIVIQDNLARSLYQLGDIGPAIRQYHLLIDTMMKLETAELSQQLGEEFGSAEFVAAYRDLSMAYLSLGINDEAACYSTLAFILGANVYEAGRHARLLLSLNREEIALNILRDVVIVRQGVVPPKILLDYGITLYLTKDRGLAKAALLRVLQQPSATRIDRQTARMILLRIALADSRARNEAKGFYDSLIEDSPRFCETVDIDSDNYWPEILWMDLKDLQLMLCDEANESLFSS